QTELRVHGTVDQTREQTEQNLRPTAFGFRRRERIVHERVFLDDEQLEFILEFKFAEATTKGRFGRRRARRARREFHIHRMRSGTDVAVGSKEAVFQMDTRGKVQRRAAACKQVPTAQTKRPRLFGRGSHAGDPFAYEFIEDHLKYFRPAFGSDYFQQAPWNVLRRFRNGVAIRRIHEGFSTGRFVVDDAALQRDRFSDRN